MSPEPQQPDAATGWGYRPELDGLRSIAIYTVVLFHVQMQWLAGGFIGVDLFFVLSGFLVTMVILAEIQRTGEFRLGAFYARRVRRLVPAAVVVVVATCLLYVLVASLPQRIDLVRDAQSALVYLANWNFVEKSNDYFATATDKSPFLHFWSLSIEEQYYLVYPLLLLLLLKLRVSATRRLVLVVVLGGLSLASQVYWAGIDPTRAYYGTDARLYQLLAGAALAMALAERLSAPQPDGAEPGSRGGPRRTRRLPAGLVAGLGLTGLLVLTTSLVDVSASTRGILATVASVAVIGGMYVSPTSWTSRVLALPVPVYLGKISYSTYLWHWPVILVLAMFLDVRPLILFVLAASVSTGLAALSMEVLEAPIRRPRLVPALRWPVAVSGFGVGLLVAGLLIAPILGSSRSPAVAGGLGGSELEGASVLAERTAALNRPVPKDLDFEMIFDDRGPDDNWCAPGAEQDCLVHEGSGPTVVLVGDSHARMVEPAIEKLAEEHDFTLYASIVSSCPWQEGLINVGAGVSNETQCHEARDDFYSTTLPAIQPDLVIFAALSRATDRWEDHLVDDQGLELPLHQLQQRTTERTIKRVADIGARSVIIKSIMGTSGFDDEGFDPLDCLARAHKMIDCAVIPPTELPIVDSFYDSLAESREDVSTVELNPYVCPGAPLCSPMLRGRVVWRNVDHVTSSVVVMLRDKIWEQLQDEGALAGFD